MTWREVLEVISHRGCGEVGADAAVVRANCTWVSRACGGLEAIPRTVASSCYRRESIMLCTSPQKIELYPEP